MRSIYTTTATMRQSSTKLLGYHRAKPRHAHRAETWLGSRADAATEPTAQQACHIPNQQTERAAATAEKNRLTWR